MNFQTLLIFLFTIFFTATVFAQQQSISGSFPPLKGQQIKLVGFQDFGIYTIDSTRVSKEGKFNLRFAEKDMGMGYLSADDNKPFFIVLDKEDVLLKGDSFSSPESVAIVSGKQNQLFAKFASEHPRREQTLSVWDYLARMYANDSLFSSQSLTRQSIENEKQRIKSEDSLALANLDKRSYLSWYLPNRKLVSAVATLVKYRPEEIPAAIKAFREFNYLDARLYKSGLLRESIENHIWLLENSSPSLESAYAQMKISIDSIIDDFSNDSNKLNMVTEFLFKLLERHSLFEASEYLALKVLNREGCTIDDDLASQLESYRAMKIGNLAPDFTFTKDAIAPGYTAADVPNKLSDIKTKYTLLVFGASWCPACSNELMQINNAYPKLKNQGVEAVFVSLDEDPETFKKFVKPFSFISMSDFQKWQSPIVKSYHVFATPIMFLLDNNQKIILRPNSAGQLESWVDWYLVKGNK